jgi:predicted permease
MRYARRFFARLANFFHPERAEREMAREIAAHLVLLEEDYQRRGMTPQEARMAARRAYGGIEQSKELHRDERSFLWLEQAWQDVRHAYRSLSKSPRFVAVAMLSLAFGIGVNTAIFTLVNGVLLKKLPVPDPDRIVQVHARIKDFESSVFSFPVFRELRRQSGIFADIIGFWPRTAVLGVDGDPHRIDLELVTGSYFSFFGARPTLGRLLDEEDDRVERAHPVCVLSSQAWQTYFGRDPQVLGRKIHVDGVPLQVVGIVPADFVGAEMQRRSDVWAPTSLKGDFSHNPRETPTRFWLRIMARLKSGVPLAEAKARLESVSQVIEAALPTERANPGALYQLSDASKGFDSWRSTLHDPLFLLMGAVALVLLVACANLANLLLARMNERHREFAIKLSIGISRWRLLRQLLVETFALALSGGVLAIIISLLLTRFLLDLFNAGHQYKTLHVAPDTSMLLFTFSACILTSLIAGLYPAWRASRTDPGSGLKGASFDGSRRSVVRRALIVVQVTLAVVLVFGASLFAHSLGKLKVINLGYDIDHVITVEIGQRGPGEVTAEVTGPPALGDVLTRVRQLPNVESAALSKPGVLSGTYMGDNITAKGGAQTAVAILLAGAGYLPTLRIPFLRGRDFSPADRRGSQPVAIVNQRLAAQFWPGQDPIGKYFDAWDVKNIAVIGVAGNSKYQDVREETQPIAYLDFDQMPGSGGTLSIRCRGSFAGIEREVRQIVKSAAPEYQVSSISTMTMLRDGLIAQDRLLAFLSSLFGVLGATLALVGIYGLISYSVARRTREIGIRISVGAQRGDVLWLFLREIALLLAAGILIGLPLALMAARFLQKMLYEVPTYDRLAIGATLLVMVAGGLFASYLPGRRATKIDPVRALRYD